MLQPGEAEHDDRYNGRQCSRHRRGRVRLPSVRREIPALGDVLGADGIAVEGTTDRARLADLTEYDIVIDYLTDPTMADAEREGLLRFVRDGGGYVGVHCAADHETFVDKPADRFEELVGGAFLDHPEPCDLAVEVVDPDLGALWSP
jgi:type 1 glutamine amidotransferase